MRVLLFIQRSITNYEIMALPMRTENQFEARGISIAGRIAAWIKTAKSKLHDEEIAELAQFAGATYRIGVKECGRAMPLEDFFPAYENWPEGPMPIGGGFRQGNSLH